MNKTALRNAILSVESLAPHVDFFLSHIRPGVDIRLTKSGITDSCSRFGGHPLVPPGFAWPDHENGEYRFLGQINFAEIADRPRALPKQGLLSLFYAYDEDGEVSWEDDDFIRGFFWEDFGDHVLAKRKRGYVKGLRLELNGTLDVPRRCEVIPNCPLDWQTMSELSNAIGSRNAHMLGYPIYNTLAYDPAPGPNWTHLLRVASFDEFEWCWHDGDQLMIFIETDKLKAKDFSTLKADAG